MLLKGKFGDLVIDQNICTFSVFIISMAAAVSLRSPSEFKKYG